MIDDRTCIFYVADRVEEIAKSANPTKKAQDFLKELNHNIGVNARVKRKNPPPEPKVVVKRQRGRPKKNG
jgi:predicted RNA-binding protein Jag